MDVSPDALRHVADLAHLHLDEGDARALADDLLAILAAAERVLAVVDAPAEPSEPAVRLRDDQPVTPRAAPLRELAPALRDDLFAVPAAFDSGDRGR